MKQHITVNLLSKIMLFSSHIFFAWAIGIIGDMYENFTNSFLPSLTNIEQKGLNFGLKESSLLLVICWEK